MATITLRSSTLVPLTHAQVDANFNNLNVAVVAAQSSADAAQATADAALAAGTQYSNLHQSATGGRIHVGATDDGVTLFQVNGSAKVGSLTATGQTSLGGLAGAESLRALAPGGTANSRVDISGGDSIGAVFPRIQASGASPNIWMNIGSAGTSGIRMWTNGVGAAEQFRVSHTANAVNYTQAQGGVAGTGVLFSAQGSDANIEYVAQSKGTFGHAFTTGGTYLPQVKVAHTANAVNYVQMTGGSTGNPPLIVALGADANIRALISSKGVSDIGFYTGNVGSQQLTVQHTANVVNSASITGSATSQPIIYSVTGPDANIGAFLRGKGVGRAGLMDSSSNVKVSVDSNGVGFFGATPLAKPSITGSRAGNAALASIITQLANLGLVTDTTTA